jgi:tetratricopeptide (TPR) repeat protein
MQIWSAEIKEVEQLYDSIKGQFPDLEKELGQLVKVEDPNVIMLYSRRCLEVMVTDLCECELKRPRKTEPLKGIIDKLHKEEIVPSHIITSMHGLNELSTYGAHPKDFDPEQVKPVLNNLSTILKWYLKYKESQSISKTKAVLEKTEPVEKFEGIKKEGRRKVLVKLFKSSRQKLMSVIIIISILLVVIAIYVYPKLFKRDTLDKLRSSNGTISVAIMPFKNMTNDTTWNIWQDGIQFSLITSLSNYSDELKVNQAELINNLLHRKGLTNYASLTPSFASAISQKLDASILIFGNINQAGNTIRVNTQIIDSKTNEPFKSFQLDGTSENILQIVDSLSLKIKNFLIINKLRKDLPVFFKNQGKTNSPEAFRYFIYGIREYYKMDFSPARHWFSQAISIDSSFMDAIMMLSLCYGNNNMYEEAKKWCLKAYEKRGQMTVQQKATANWLHAQYFETPFEEIIYLREMLDFDDQNPHTYYRIGNAYSDLLDYKDAIPELEKVFEILKKWDVKPYWINFYTLLGYAYFKTGMYEKEKKLYLKAEQDLPSEPDIDYWQAILSLTEKDTIAANKYIKKLDSFHKDFGVSEAYNARVLGSMYMQAGILDKAEGYYRQSVSLEPENISNSNDLAYFLIYKDRNISEGLELFDKALKIDPLNNGLLDHKGWGLYKQGKYQEALECMQKGWNLRMKNRVYDHSAFLHLEEARKAVSGQK